MVKLSYPYDMNQVNQICKKGGAEAPPVSWHIKLCCLPKRLTDPDIDERKGVLYGFRKHRNHNVFGAEMIRKRCGSGACGTTTFSVQK